MPHSWREECKTRDNLCSKINSDTHTNWLHIRATYKILWTGVIAVGEDSRIIYVQNYSFPYCADRQQGNKIPYKDSFTGCPK